MKKEYTIEIRVAKTNWFNRFFGVWFSEKAHYRKINVETPSTIHLKASLMDLIDDKYD